MIKTAPRLFAYLFFLVCLSFFILTACSSESIANPASNNSDISNDSASSAYPGANPGNLTPESAYPGPKPTIEGLQTEPPDPALNLPDAQQTSGVVGGVLIREVVDQGFIPLVPKSLVLGEIITTDNGQPAYVRTSGKSAEAELFPTGIFIFRNVPPGTYGLVVDLGFTQFLVKSTDGNPLTFTVEAGQVLDIGQVITQLPG